MHICISSILYLFKSALVITYHLPRVCRLARLLNDETSQLRRLFLIILLYNPIVSLSLDRCLNYILTQFGPFAQRDHPQRPFSSSQGDGQRWTSPLRVRWRQFAKSFPHMKSHNAKPAGWAGRDPNKACSPFIPPRVQPELLINDLAKVVLSSFKFAAGK